MSAFLVRHRLSGRDGKGMPAFDLYLCDERPERSISGVEFVGRRVRLEQTYRHGPAHGYAFAETVPLWRELPSATVTVEQVRPGMRVPAAEPLRRVA